jgi:hypothetical protein
MIKNGFVQYWEGRQPDAVSRRLPTYAIPTERLYSESRRSMPQMRSSVPAMSGCAKASNYPDRRLSACHHFVPAGRAVLRSRDTKFKKGSGCSGWIVGESYNGISGLTRWVRRRWLVMAGRSASRSQGAHSSGASRLATWRYQLISAAKLTPATTGSSRRQPAKLVSRASPDFL